MTTTQEHPVPGAARVDPLPTAPLAAGRPAVYARLAIVTDLDAVRRRRAAEKALAESSPAMTDSTLTDPLAGAPRRPAVDGSDPEVLVADLLGDDGLPSVPGVAREDVVSAATDLIGQLMGVEDCWLQAPGRFAESLAAQLDRGQGVRLSNLSPKDGAWGPLGGGSTRGAAVGLAEVVVAGERHLLVVWSRGPRAWTPRDHRLLVFSADTLAAALERMVAGQRSPAQRARAQFDEMRRELLTTVNHELRTPLSVIRGGVELLAEAAEDHLSGPEQRLLARVETSVARLLDIAQNASLMARGTPDPLLADLARADVDEVVTDVLARAVPASRELGVRQHTAPGTSARIASDDLREILDRLVDNAVTFTPDGGMVSVSVAEVEGEQVEIVVADTGVGIPEDEQHHVGEPFFRSRTSSSLEHQGAGLSLAAAMAMAASWQGSIVLDSAPGGGTEARLRLPRGAACQD
ncbi:sensor histidine kinase [Nocardioides bruguierae]|uniref:histidine kinase n=1 Tax=Nocardioides bruguierae TaxID=2945102 RepID=A0A9X2D5F0_9ACTN|nr:HAMP domain-containing sensor histidine kinase [Nocardioides bruguierae]MCM0619157.1 HAMP domain-containing histidine kinase [Nocardioides bruguierae]